MRIKEYSTYSIENRKNLSMQFSWNIKTVATQNEDAYVGVRTKFELLWMSL